MKAKIGTSGFQYPEWKGKFYPEKMAPAKMLAFYAEHFSTTEVNYTFRRIPSLSTLEKWSQSTPTHFVFSLKAPQSITHWAKLRDCTETTEHFIEVVKSLGEKLGPILFQLPPNFSLAASLLNDFLASLPRGIRAAFEFRDESWFTDEVYAILAKHNTALCLAESDELATPFVATADFGYLRLRRENYSTRDLTKWAAQIGKQKERWSDALIYFKHEEKATGPAFAEKMKAHFK